MAEDEHVVLEEAGSPYQSDGSLIIDGHLEIKPNVTIRMDDGSSLLVRKGSLKAVGTAGLPITLEQLTESEWSGLSIEKKIAVAPGFRLLLGYTALQSYSVGQDDFNALFEGSQSKTLVRYCPNCYDSHQVLFYKRISDIGSFDAYNALVCNFTSADNELNTDFELYNSMEDFLLGANQWSYCYFMDGYGFPGRCGATYSTYYQSSQFSSTCPSSHTSYKDEVYWFLYDEDLPEEKYKAYWSPTETSDGLPLVFISVEDIEMKYVKISGAGADSTYSLSIARPSSIAFKHVSILDGLRNGIRCSGRGSYYFEDLVITSDKSSSGNGFYVSDKANVTISRYFISTAHSGSAIYAYGSSVSLALYNGKIEPRSNNQVCHGIVDLNHSMLLFLHIIFISTVFMLDMHQRHS